MKRDTRQTLLIATLLILLFGIVKHGSRLLPDAGEFGFMAAMLFQLYVPIWLIRKEGSVLSEYSISSYGILELSGSIDWKALGLDLRRVFLLILVTFPPFWAGYHALQLFLAAHNGYILHFALSLPKDFINLLLTSFLLVALPEEVFYRGFVQTRLLREWPNRTVFWGIPAGKAIIITSAFFAFGHFIGEYHLGRLTPFFPAFLFSYLVFRSHSIVGAVIFHAICNIFAQILSSSYFFRMS